jgi:hypothetical protein
MPEPKRKITVQVFEIPKGDNPTPLKDIRVFLFDAVHQKHLATQQTDDKGGCTLGLDEYDDAGDDFMVVFDRYFLRKLEQNKGQELLEVSGPATHDFELKDKNVSVATAYYQVVQLQAATNPGGNSTVPAGGGTDPEHPGGGGTGVTTADGFHQLIKNCTDDLKKWDTDALMVILANPPTSGVSDPPIVGQAKELQEAIKSEKTKLDEFDGQVTEATPTAQIADKALQVNDIHRKTGRLRKSMP